MELGWNPDEKSGAVNIELWPWGGSLVVLDLSWVCWSLGVLEGMVP